MANKFYVNAAGKWLGNRDDDTIPDGGIEVPEAPEDGRQVWNNVTLTWGPKPPRFASEVRVEAYVAQLGRGDAPFANTVVGILEILVLEQLARGAAVTPAFTALVTKMNQIRTANPGV